MPIETHCPKCGSENIRFSKKFSRYDCEECAHVFMLEKPFASKRIFISYGHDEHVSLAIHLRDDLRTRKHTVWFDEERLQPGHDWEAFIEKGLEHLAADKPNAAVILLLTPHSVRRPDGYCLNEVARALSRGLRIIPLMVVESEPPLSICRIQWLDMRQCLPIHEKEAFYRPRFERLLKALEEDQLDFEGTHQRLLKALQPLEFDADILQHIPKFTGRKWVLNALQRWLAEMPMQRVFWICGGPGVGKTALSALLSNRFLEIAALHLCKFGHAQKSDPRRVVTSLAYQLSTQLPEYEARLATMDLELHIQGDARTQFDNLLVQPLAKITPPSRPVVILIDALDEASREERNELASFIATEFSKTPAWLRLIITSRPEAAVTAPLQAMNPFILDTEIEANRADLRDYLRRELDSKLHGRSDADDIIEQILNRSEGVFLYVERVCNEIVSGNVSLNRMDQIPQGLGGMFWHFFERQFPTLDEFRRTVRPSLRVILAAREPLPLQILQRLSNWSAEDLRDFTRSLGSLFPITVEGGREVIKPCHKALADWLSDEKTAGPFYVSVNEGMQSLAGYLWNEYLNGVHNMSEFAVRFAPLYLLHANMHGQAETLNLNELFCERRKALGFDSSGVSRAAITELTMGRTEIIRQIDQGFANRGIQIALPSPRVVAICGKMLAGKTRSAMEYADTFSHRYAKCLLVDAQPDLLTAIADACAASQGNKGKISQRDVVNGIEALSRWCDGIKRGLLVLDDVSQQQQQPLVSLIANIQPHIDVLITSECGEWPESFVSLQLDGLGETAAIDFLLSATKSQKPEEEDEIGRARDLARALGFRPLALETASRLITQERLSFADYLRLCATQRPKN